ncbi:MAG TPA: TetR/AcrR family transcriptional regulator [Ohtaekwangia sp.]
MEKTSSLFNQKGFDGTSLVDLTSATGLTKGALYGNFKDKEEIRAEAFRYSVSQVKSMVRSHLNAAGTHKKRLQALLEFYARYVLNPPIPGGCPLLNTAIEADDHHTFMRRLVAEELMATVRFISGILQKGVEAGEFRKDINPDELAYLFFCSVEGALMFARAERSEEPMKIIVKHCKNILDEISIND